jgi:cysteine desulfurase/selenocysteine lyase
MKFEAGTPGIVQQIGLGRGARLHDGRRDGEHRRPRGAPADYARAQLDGLNWLNVQGQSAGQGAIFSFTIDGAGHAHDISTVLDKKGVAVRAGHHCAQPLMEHMGVSATCRASFRHVQHRGGGRRAGRRACSCVTSCSPEG